MKRIYLVSTLLAVLLSLLACEPDDLVGINAKIQVDKCAEPDFISDCALDFGEVPKLLRKRALVM